MINNVFLERNDCINGTCFFKVNDIHHGELEHNYVFTVYKHKKDYNSYCSPDFTMAAVLILSCYNSIQRSADCTFHKETYTCQWS